MEHYVHRSGAVGIEPPMRTTAGVRSNTDAPVLALLDTLWREAVIPGPSRQACAGVWSRAQVPRRAVGAAHGQCTIVTLPTVRAAEQNQQPMRINVSTTAHG